MNAIEAKLSDQAFVERLKAGRGRAEILSVYIGANAGIGGDDGIGGKAAMDLKAALKELAAAIPAPMVLHAGYACVHAANVLVGLSAIPAGAELGEAPVLDISWQAKTAEFSYELIFREEQSVSIPSQSDLLVMAERPIMKLMALAPLHYEAFEAALGALGVEPVVDPEQGLEYATSIERLRRRDESRPEG